MTNVMFCKICLNVNVKMYNLEEYSLEECYKNVIGNSYEQNLKSLQYACYECAYFIQKYYLFKQKCLRSQSYLSELYKKNGKITFSEINCIDRQNLRLCSNLSSVINLSYDQVNHCDIKIEFDVNEPINANNAISVQDHNFKTEERMKQEDEAQDGDFEIEPIFTLPFEKMEIPKLKKNNTGKKSPQRKIKFIEVSLKGTSNDCVEQAVNESIKEENNGVPTCIKNNQSRVKKRRKTEPKRNSNESPPEETSIRDNVTVVKLTIQEQIQEVLKRKNSSNYLNAEYKCNLCYKGFIDPDAYSHHMKRHDTVSGSKQCPVCKIAFPTQRALQRHTGNHDKHYICKTCSQVSKTLTQAKQHQHSHTGKIYKCEHCGNISLKLSSYLTHIRLKHPSEFVCEICSYSFVSKLGLSRHKSMMHKYQVAPQDSTEKQVRYCKACNVFFNSPQNWKRHIASVGHKIKTSQDFTCGMCKEILPSGDELRLHNRLVHPRRGVRRVVNARVPRVWPAKCQHCDSELLNAHKYFYHIRKAHPDEPYSTPKNHVCDICGKRYRANAFLVYHRRTHFNDRPYKCTKCPKAFFNRINLLGHEKSHSDQRPFPCSVCCKAFKTHGGLQRHFLFPSLEQEWIAIAEEFERRWQFPNCLGAVDGKHVAIVPPAGADSHFFNYKGYHSIVLMAIANANYEFIYVDTGTNGRISDGGVLEKTKFFQRLNSKNLNLPSPIKPSGHVEELPYVFIGDEAFALRTDFIKPYPQKQALASPK